MMNFDTSQYTYALVTSTTYGTWLPGENRGFVDDEHNQYDTPFLINQPSLKNHARHLQKESTVLFQKEHADIILACWLKITPEYQWHLFIVAVMPNHFHLVVAAPGQVDKSTLLRNFKSRAANRLNTRFGKRTWWTASGSVRFCFDEKALQTRIRYVKNQKSPLTVWLNPENFHKFNNNALREK